jgi:glycogen operon protein
VGCRPEINALRSRQQRNFLTTLLLSQGVPMICHGDEVGRSQSGNNNGYCQDNGITWVDWGNADTQLLHFTTAVAALRAAHPVFRRKRFFNGRPVRQRGREGLPDISWFRPDGTEMSDEDWDSGFGKSVTVYLNGQGIPDLDARGRRVTDDSFTMCFNAPTASPSNSFCHLQNSGWLGSPSSTPRPAQARWPRRRR